MAISYGKMVIIGAGKVGSAILNSVLRMNILDEIVVVNRNQKKALGEVLDASHMLYYPGLVNTHHHLYQQFSRNRPQAQNMELFDWLKTLYEIWKNLDAEVIRL